VELRFKLAASEALIYRFVESARQVSQRETGQSRTELQREGIEEVRVADVDAGGVMTLDIRRQIQRSIVDGVSRIEAPRPAFRVRMTPLGSLLDASTGHPTSTELFVLLPDSAVRVGEGWARSAERDQGRSRFTARETYLLASWSAAAGGAVVRIRAAHEFQGTGGRVAGLPESVEADQTTRFIGEYDFHVERGRLLRAVEETNEEIRFRGTAEGRPVEGSQTRVLARRVELTGP
jgi:hypothetical protein